MHLLSWRAASGAEKDLDNCAADVAEQVAVAHVPRTGVALVTAGDMSRPIIVVTFFRGLTQSGALDIPAVRTSIVIAQ